MVMATLILGSYIIYLDRKIVPLVLAIGELKAQEMITRVVNESILTVLKRDRDIGYRDLIFIKEDSEGNIVMMQADTFLMNRIASDVALTIQERFGQTKNVAERIPLGNILGSQLFAQWGPKIKLTVTPKGMVDVNFGTEFEHAGINQTRHRVYLIVNTEAKIIVPFNSSNMHVTTYLPVAETIIVGKIPENYIYVPFITLN
ncbi:MAG: sporulation protein YunB [Clostridiales bacterium]|nr:sporulation protein YunB [Clostridiales bacterium]